MKTAPFLVTERRLCYNNCNYNKTKRRHVPQVRYIDSVKYSFSNKHFPKEMMTDKLRSVNPICLDILYNRGIENPVEMEAVLFPDLKRSLRECPVLHDMDKAIDILADAVQNRLPIVVYHDYDADGITSAAVFCDCMAHFDIPVYQYSNTRAVDGFGICADGVDRIMEQHPDVKVLVTVDNGISGLTGVTRAKQYGLRVLVTDHHEQGRVLPGADAVVDPKRNDEPEGQYRDSCGAGVIWEIMLALYVRLGMDLSPVRDALDIAALGTISDVVSLAGGKNRAIVHEGLKLMSEGRRPFFRVMKELFRFGEITSELVAFQITPKINAVSRMEQDASQVVRLMLSTDETELRTGLSHLDELNIQRRQESDRETELAEQYFADREPGSILIFRDASLKEGIVGIVAGKLKETYGLPSLVFAPDGKGSWKGSCRAPEGFHMKKALDQVSDLLMAYGGHAKAAGVTVPDGNFEAFEADMQKLAAGAEIPEEIVPIDAVLPSASYTESLCRELSILEPSGEGFPKPVFGLVADITDVRFMGNCRQHVKYLDRTGLSVIQWNMGDRARARRVFPRKFVGSPSLNFWNGTTSVQFICR